MNNIWQHLLSFRGECHKEVYEMTMTPLWKKNLYWRLLTQENISVLKKDSAQITKLQNIHMFVVKMTL